MGLIIMFAVGILTGSFLTVFCVAATNLNNVEEDEDDED